MDAVAWVYETVSKMDPGEARMFAMFVADDLHDWTIENNQRRINGFYDQIQKSMDDDLARYFLRELQAGEDPEKLVAEAASVAVAKADFKNTWWQKQGRGEGGRWGEMGGGYVSRKHYKALQRNLKSEKNLQNIKVKEMAGGKVPEQYLHGIGQEEAQAALQHGLRSNQAGRVSYYGQEMQGPVRDFDARYHSAASGHGGATDTMNRVAATGNLVTSLGIASNRPGVAVAGQLATVAGTYGPEAEKVIGPSMRKAAYRYRGTERRPDKQLNAMVEQSSSRLMHEEGISREPGVKPSAHLQPEEKVAAANDAAIRYMLGMTPASYVAAGKGTGKVGAGPGSRLDQNARRQNTKVPSAQMADLHRQSGRVTPSEGIMIDGEGNIVAQAVGYGEDHYLPFNLKNLGALKGGSYVRTRESGGLTSEDVYAGLMSGARSMTVVSNSGIFTMNFDDDLRGGRRYNDKAKQMVGRYEKTLDAIQSKEVMNPSKKMDSKTKAAIRIKVEDELASQGLTDLPEEEVEGYVKDAIREYSRKPQLTPEKEAEIEAHVAQIKETDGEGAARQAGYQLRDEALQNVAGQNYRLDGEGYDAALKALKEQFPYYIDSVNTVTANRAEDNSHSDLATIFSNTEDRAYVKPKFNRPQGAREGYFDPTIEGKEKGKSKYGADTLHYQNYANRKRAASTSTGTSTESAGQSSDQNIRARGEATRGNNQQRQQNDKLSAAAKESIEGWNSANSFYTADPRNTGNLTMFNEADHPTFLAYNKLDSDEDKARFLANPENLKSLGREEEKLFQTHGARLSDHSKIRAMHTAAQQFTAPAFDEEKVKGTIVPMPMSLDNDALNSAKHDQGVRAHLGKSESTLAAQSKELRDRRDKFEREGVSAHTESLTAQIKRIELARAVKQTEALKNPQQAAAPSAPSSAPAPSDPNVIRGEVENAPPQQRALPAAEQRDAFTREMHRIANSNLSDTQKRVELSTLFVQREYGDLSDEEKRRIVTNSDLF